MNRQIRELKKKIQYETSPEKEALIDKIHKLKPSLKAIKMDLNPYTLERLQKYYEKHLKNKLIIDGRINRERLEELTTEKTLEEWEKKILKLVKYVVSELDKAKSNNITIDCGRYLNEKELHYIKSLNIFKNVRNEMLNCMIYFER